MSNSPPRREFAPHRSPAAEARRAESLSQAMLQAVLDPTLAIDAFGIVVMASNSVERFFGWPPEELIGQNVHVLMPEPHRSGHDSYLADYRATGKSSMLGRTREFSVLHRDGHEFEIELSVSLVELADGSPPLFIGSFRDISQRKAAQRLLAESERRLRSVFEGSFQYIALLDCEGIVLEANETSLEATGCSLEEVVGKPYWETRWWSVTEETRQRVKEAVERARAGELVRFETVQRGRGDEVHIVDFSIKPLRNDEDEVVLLIPEGRDISEIKRAQRSETAMLRALATIGESAAMLAHEIKNPITAVNLALRAVAHQLGEDDAAVLEDLVGRMQRLEKTMRRTLAYARPMELDLEAVRVQTLFEQVLGDLRPEFEKHATHLEQRLEQPDLIVRLDGQLLGEALTNLLKNALEALQRGGHVVLAAESTASSRLEISVEDDGPGIPAEISENLFRPFVTSRHAGTGLGLAFCRKIAEEHGGSIHVERGALGGARFVIDIPLA